MQNTLPRFWYLRFGPTVFKDILTGIINLNIYGDRIVMLYLRDDEIKKMLPEMYIFEYRIMLLNLV